VALSRPKYGFDSRWGYSHKIQSSPISSNY
jgi:hypothetical protein